MNERTNEEQNEWRARKTRTLHPQRKLKKACTTPVIPIQEAGG
jgi:hypothetical protein